MEVFTLIKKSFGKHQMDITKYEKENNLRTGSLKFKQDLKKT